MATEKRQRKKQGHQARLEAARAEARRLQRRRRLITTAVLTVVAVAALFAISALGGDDDESDVATDDTTETSAAEPTTTTTLDITKPEVTIPAGEAPPTDTVITDLEEGDGAEAALGDEVEVHYVGVSFADGKPFDSSWDRGAPATFTLQEGGLIEGWIKGLPGMKVGGRRQLVIPGTQAYGDEDTGDGRPHGALVFVIDLLAVK